jgi:tetratricopeptide (TPR) repeat protein
MAELGRAYDAAGEPDSALPAYEQAATAPDPARFFSDGLRLLPPTLKRLGELYEQRGNREKALEYYGRFVNLWKDADAALQPVVQEVRQRMTRLAREQP